MRPIASSLAGLSALALAGCATVPAGPVAAVPDSCPISASSDWTAWINAMPGPDRPQLIVTGKVAVPSGGYTFAWRDLKTMESYPTQAMVDLEALPPDGPATQAIQTHELRGEWTAEQPIGSVTVRCGTRVLARISPVRTAS